MLDFSVKVFITNAQKFRLPKSQKIDDFSTNFDFALKTVYKPEKTWYNFLY